MPNLTEITDEQLFQRLKDLETERDCVILEMERRGEERFPGLPQAMKEAFQKVWNRPSMMERSKR